MISSSRLKEIGECIRVLHAGLLASMKLSTEKAIAIGKLLDEVKRSMRLRDFHKWVADNCGFCQRSAYKYIKLSRLKVPLAELSKLKLTEAYEAVGIPNRRDSRQTSGRLALRFEEFRQAHPHMSAKELAAVKLFLAWLKLKQTIG